MHYILVTMCIAARRLFLAYVLGKKPIPSGIALYEAQGERPSSRKMPVSLIRGTFKLFTRFAFQGRSLREQAILILLYELLSLLNGLRCHSRWRRRLEERYCRGELEISAICPRHVPHWWAWIWAEEIAADAELDCIIEEDQAKLAMEREEKERANGTAYDEGW